jgi:hypothetical protein
MLYFKPMNSQRANWPEWIEALRRRGLDGFAAWLLEAGGPVNIIGAQLLYISQPFIGSQAGDGIRLVANLLEEEDEARAFAALLRRKPSIGGTAHERLEGHSQ